MKAEKYEFLEHTADIKFRAFGKILEEIFNNSALALNDIIKGKIKIKSKIEKSFIIKGEDNMELLYNLLEEILYLLDAEDFLMSKIKIKLVNKNKLDVKISGDKASNYKFTNNVKAVTYNEMFVKKDKNKWIAQVVLDV
ncbi:MAG: archease [Nanoarchaeota archaeon]